MEQVLPSLTPQATHTQGDARRRRQWPCGLGGPVSRCGPGLSPRAACWTQVFLNDACRRAGDGGRRCGASQGRQLAAGPPLAGTAPCLPPPPPPSFRVKWGPGTFKDAVTPKCGHQTSGHTCMCWAPSQELSVQWDPFPRLPSTPPSPPGFLWPVCVSGG